jgi:hypothetical protein
MLRDLAAALLGVAVASLPMMLPAQTVVPVPTYPKDIPPQPKIGDGLTMRPAPEIFHLAPENFVVQGDRIQIVGLLAPSELVVTIGSPATALPIIARSQEPDSQGRQWVVVEVPANYETPGAQLVARHGSIGAATIVAPSYRVLRRPPVTGFQIVTAPVINMSAEQPVATKLLVKVADYVPGLAAPVIRFPECRAQQKYEPSKITVGIPTQIEFNVVFDAQYFPGGACRVDFYPYGTLPHHWRPPYNVTLPGKVQLPLMAAYTIENTEELLKYTSPSGKALRATASNGSLPCQLLSVGAAGRFSTGVVIDGGDLSFQLRSGALPESCSFRTTDTLVVHDNWQVAEVDWNFSTDMQCYTSNVPPSPDGKRVKAVVFDATCMPNMANRADNSHLFKARLARIVLRGPANRSWRDAFK